MSWIQPQALGDGPFSLVSIAVAVILFEGAPNHTLTEGRVGLALAEELRGSGRPVTLLDANPDHGRGAEEAGWPVVCGNALEHGSAGLPRDLLEPHHLRVPFDGPRDVERWNVRFRHALTERVRVRFDPAADTPRIAAVALAPFLMLAHERGGQVEPMHQGAARGWRPADPVSRGERWAALESSRA
jgi:hypothetical protein